MIKFSKCKDCGKHLKDYRSTYCKKCVQKHSKRYKNGITTKNYYCIDCNSSITVASGLFGGGRCRKCADKQHSLRMMGSNNPNYKDGRKSLQKAIRDHKKYKHWIYRIFERDKYTCQICNSTNCHLHVHHKIPLICIILLYKLKNLVQALKCPLLWDENWGITLCIPCHNRIEKKVFYHEHRQERNKEISESFVEG